MAKGLTLSGGVYLPLLSLNAVIDTDLGLLNYVFKEFRNEELFDLNILDYKELINKVYYRPFKNPLYVIMKNPDSEEDKKFLDECYQEFIVTKEMEILQNSLSTQLAELMKSFVEDPSIKPSLLYYSDTQLEYIKSIEEFDDLGLVSATKVVTEGQKSYSQIFLKYIEELYLFTNVYDRTFYISNTGLNMVDEHDNFRQEDIIDETILRRNQVNIYNLYRTDIIGKDFYKYG